MEYRAALEVQIAYLLKSINVTVEIENSKLLAVALNALIEIVNLLRYKKIQTLKKRINLMLEVKTAVATLVGHN